MDALDVIKKCKELNRKIFGIDAFKITEKITQPILEHSIDYKIVQESDNGNWSEAIKFLQERMNEDFVYEIIYE